MNYSLFITCDKEWENKTWKKMVTGEIKVHLNPNNFFLLNKSLHLFEMHFAFLNLILTFL